MICSRLIFSPWHTYIFCNIILINIRLSRCVSLSYFSNYFNIQLTQMWHHKSRGILVWHSTLHNLSPFVLHNRNVVLGQSCSYVSFYFLNSRSMIIHLQEIWKIQNKVTYSFTIYYNYFLNRLRFSVGVSILNSQKLIEWIDKKSRRI